MTNQDQPASDSESSASNSPDTGADADNSADSNADGSTDSAFEAAVASLEAEESGADGQADADQSNDGESDVAADAADATKTEDKPKAPNKPTDEAKRLRKLGTTLATRDANLQKREMVVKAIEGKAAFVDKVLDLRNRDKIAAIREIGISEDEIVDLVMKRAEAANAGPETAEDRIARVEKQLADERAARTQAGKQAQEVQFRGEVAAAIKADESLDLVNSEPDSVDMVITAMAAYHQKHGVVPNPVHIARQLETALEKRERERFGKSKKFELSDRRTVKNNDAKPANSSPPAKKGPSVTLTDHMADSVSMGDDGLPDDPDARFNALVAQMNA